MKEHIYKIYKTLKENWIFSLIMILLSADLTQQVFALKAYKSDNDVIHYEKLVNIVSLAETNSSVESMQITELMSRIDSTAKVYMIKEGDDKLSVLALKDERMLLVKHIPSISMTFTLESKLLDKGISYEWVEKKEKPKAYISKLLNTDMLHLLLLAGVIYFLFTTSGGKLFAKDFVGRDPDEIEGNFSELIGYEEIKTEARQLFHIVSQKEQYAKYGINGTFNILLSGKAGTGKSRFALYLAKELNVPIVSSTGSLEEVYVGTGAKKIRDLFKEANKRAEASKYHTCIIFIDEGQNLLRKRGRSDDHKWEDDTSNELLAHLDGVQKNQKNNIIVIIASNFNEVNLEMDEAMLRRFKKKIHFREPNLEEREAILTHYLDKIERKNKEIDIPYLAKNMSGMTPATIKSVVQEAGLMAMRDKCIVDTRILFKAFERLVVGQSSRAVTEEKEKARKVIAVHETGHFLVELYRAIIISNGDMKKAKEFTRILKISSESIAHIGALGFTMREQDEGMILQSVDDIQWDIRQLYGGVAAEEVIFGKMGMTTGASDDIEKATRLLEHMIVQNSVYNATKLNYKVLGMENEKIIQIEERSEKLYDQSLEILQKFEPLLRYLSNELMEQWTLDKEQLFELIKAHDELYLQSA